MTPSIAELHRDDDVCLVRIIDRPEESSNLAQSALSSATEMLEQQWPSGAPYRDKLLSSQSSTEFYSLPSSYFLLKEGVCIGHGRLTSCYEGSMGMACAATYILIQPDHRSKRLGSRLMKLLENEARRLGYHYLYLWTNTAIHFYEKLGYKPTQRVSLHRACLKKIKREQILQLEAMLSQRAGKTNETVLLPPSDGMTQTEDDVWLRKRLVEHVDTAHTVSLEQRIEELDRFTSSLAPAKYRFRLQSIPFQPQIGPSCGLACLRMLRDFYLVDRKMPSLLSAAQELGFSHDGEVFDANNLLTLATDVCGLDCTMHSLLETSLEEILNHLDRGESLLFAYDALQGRHTPVQNSGQSAHYGMLVGVLLGTSLDEGESSTSLKSLEVQENPRADSVHFLVQHGLSDKLAMAPMEDWIASNQQLRSVNRTLFSSEHLDLIDRLIVVHGEAAA